MPWGKSMTHGLTTTQIPTGRLAAPVPRPTALGPAPLYAPGCIPPGWNGLKPPQHNRARGPEQRTLDSETPKSRPRNLELSILKPEISIRKPQPEQRGISKAEHQRTQGAHNQGGREATPNNHPRDHCPTRWSPPGWCLAPSPYCIGVYVHTLPFSGSSDVGPVPLLQGG